jgi:bifunctional non-homologous end joining protein LigD
MALEQYRAKRNFDSTPEPRPTATHAGEGYSFAVQKHDARRLHYDFRLELDGVLKSWAVTKGPSLVPGEKRLAVMVEDHPLEYGSFEGTIPKGEYGGGAVLLWDRGTWAPIGDPHKGLAKGHLDFELMGEKLKGRWHLVRMRARPRDKHENWLLIKGDDEFARSEDSPDILQERPESAASGRPIGEVAKESPGWSSKTGRIERSDHPVQPPDPASVKGAKRTPALSFIEPMLATLVPAPTSSGRCLHEIKLDGYRVEALIDKGRVTLLTRRGLDWTAKFGKALVEAFRALPVSQALIDGELVVEKASGATDFSALQAALSEGRTERLVFYAFDLLYLNGFDLREAPLVERKKLLETIAGGPGPLRYSGHFEGDGEIVFLHACRLGLEGIVSKLRDSPYRSGRSKSWTKAKCSARQEFVIGGFVPSTVARNAIGSLVLGVYDGDALRYVGRVGTGFSAAIARDLYVSLEPMRLPSSPFSNRLSAAEARQVRYVRPELVAEVDVRGWTADGLLRQASFEGLREDKPAREIVRETLASDPPAQTSMSTIELTHPDRLYWPDDGVTKQGLADYYAEVWPRMAPLLVGRALALVRCPDGVTGQKFFQKHAWKGMSSAIALVKDPEEEKSLISIRDLDGLMALVQMAVLEIHPWGSTVFDWERPDTIVMDLDPGEDVVWETVIEAAREVRQRLEDAGLAAFVKTSGGKGLHVVAPVKPKAEWPAIKAFTKGIADAMVADSPQRYVATIAKAKRTGKILIDYLRNQRGTTAIAAYSTRARPGAAVSMPIDWSELGPGIGPAHFTVANAPQRLAALASNPWEGFRAAEALIGS